MSIKSFRRKLALLSALTAANLAVCAHVHGQGSVRYPNSRSLVEPLPVADPMGTGSMVNYESEQPYNPNSIPVAQPIGTGVNTQGVPQNRVAQAGHNYNSQANSVAATNLPTMAQPMARNRSGVMPANAGNQRPQMTAARPMAQQGGRVAPAGYVPSHMRSRQQVRTAQMISEVPFGSAQPAVSQGVMPGVLQAPATSGEPYYDEGMAIGDSYVDEGGDCGCDDCGSGDCGSCGFGCDTGCGLACERGGCPPGLIDECWLGGLGTLLYRGDYFAGAQCWDSPTFLNSQRSDYNGGSGFYAGANLGIPLCRLTCGLLSGQAGVRTVQSEISGSPNISQIFATGGFFRRVDYGLQFGVVADYLREDFLFEAEVMQLRGDLSWQYAGGNSFGFRFSRGIQDDQVPEIVPGAGAAQFRLETLDAYRFYYRVDCVAGGFTDMFLGWSDGNQIVGGLDLDMPMTERLAVQSGVTYLLPTENPANGPGGNANDGWNLYVGFAFRPQGRCYYQNYDRPILPVADNGSMILRRGF